ncbi:MAG: hypothetical protein ABIN89_23665, partial [Chitinophagaceae bacterium]
FKRSQNDTSAGSFAGGVTIPGMRGYHKTEWGVTMLRCIHLLSRPEKTLQFLMIILLLLYTGFGVILE